MSIGHYRKKEGYKNTWTDVYDFPDGDIPERNLKKFVFTAEKNDGDLYF